MYHQGQSEPLKCPSCGENKWAVSIVERTENGERKDVRAFDCTGCGSSIRLVGQAHPTHAPR